jgi:hypothetical protein
MTFRSFLYCILFECPKLKYAENCAHTARWKMWIIVCKVYIFFGHLSSQAFLYYAGCAGLAAYIFTKSIPRSWRVSESLEYGLVGVNEGIISTEVRSSQ